MTTPYEDFQNAAPYKWEIELPMVANSTVETAVEIQTGIPAGSEVGWNIVGIEAQFLNNTSPFLPVDLSSAKRDYCLQLCRGNVPATPVKLSPFNNDVVMEWGHQNFVGDVTGMLASEPLIHRESAMEQTQMPHLYLMFVTLADWVIISANTFSLFVNLLYYPVPAPSAPREML